MRHISILSGLFLVLLFPIHSSMAATPDIIISEVQITGTTASDDFIELLNTTGHTIDMTGWKLKKRIQSGTESSIRDLSVESGFHIDIPAGGHLLWANSGGTSKSFTDARFTSSTSLTDNNSLALFDKAGALIDAVTYGSGHANPFSPSTQFPTNPTKGQSLIRDPETLSINISSAPSPENTAIIKEDAAEVPPPIPDSETASENIVIRINELFPNPVAKSEENEWIELRNPEDENADISGFTLRDASASGKYIFPQGTVIPGDGYLVVERSESGLSLNNTDETVSLSDTHETVVDTMSYEKTKEEASLSFDGSSFRWSPFLTPGKANRFGEKPEAKKTSIPEKGYKDVSLEFTASESDGQEFLWDFGDGKTSRKQSTSHAYAKTGVYRGTLTVTDEDGIGENVKEFTVEIENFPKVKLSITAIAPNPKGADTGVEWISVKNSGKKRLDLFGFGIATGSSKKKLTNHPISESLVIKAGREKQITSADASFTLPNEGGYVEIRRPDGKMVIGKSYKKQGGIKDDEVWRKIAGKSWEWVKEPSKNQKNETTEAASEKNSDTELETTTESAPVAVPVTEEPRKITLEDLSPEQLALLEARVEERLRTQILAELEASGKLAAMPETDADTGSGTVLGTSDEKPSTSLTQKLNALLGRVLFGN